MATNKPIKVDIHYNKSDLTFMFEGREFRRMVGISKKKQVEALSTLSENIKLKRGHFNVIEQKDWNNLMQDAWMDIQPFIPDKIEEYATEHDISAYAWVFGYCEIPDLIYFSYRDVK